MNLPFNTMSASSAPIPRMAARLRLGFEAEAMTDHQFRHRWPTLQALGILDPNLPAQPPQSGFAIYMKDVPGLLGAHTAHFPVCWLSVSQYEEAKKNPEAVPMPATEPAWVSLQDKVKDFADRGRQVVRDMRADRSGSVEQLWVGMATATLQTGLLQLRRALDVDAEDF